jgi:hypothetical protein
MVIKTRSGGVMLHDKGEFQTDTEAPIYVELRDHPATHGNWIAIGPPQGLNGYQTRTVPGESHRQEFLELGSSIFL